jgi:two-component system cell cycle sensor histidine kinase/response regulator CckA
MDREHQARIILMVEDDEHLRQMNAAVLERAGFVVLQAGDSNEAAEIWEKDQDRIEVLFADILVPGLSGPEIAREFLKEKPELKVVFMTGSDRSVVTETAKLVKGARFLQKPFGPRVLIESVRSAIVGA